MRLVLQDTTFITLLLLESNKRNKENTALSCQFSSLYLTLLRRLSGLASFNSPINYESDSHRVVSVPVTGLLLYFHGERFYSLFGHRKTTTKKSIFISIRNYVGCGKKKTKPPPWACTSCLSQPPLTIFPFVLDGDKLLLHDSPRNAWHNPGKGSAQPFATAHHSPITGTELNA